ncbi:HK97 gp10 family phage protein [Streptomyces sp. NPDC048338]|uniref:HK97 gp10 family phage protein n=1 Tax=Streptomyces sp. NPDC048338 TaxID=3365536 RepID=UPI0037166BBC
MARLRLDRAALNRQLTASRRRKGDDVARRVVNRAKVLAPVDTGRLRASIRMESRRTFTLKTVWTVGSDVYYAPYVNDGTRPHVIRPKTKQALRFKVGGRVVFARVVNHPGTRPQPFLDRALREVALAEGFTVRTNR